MKRQLIRVGIVLLAMLVLKLLVRAQEGGVVAWDPVTTCYRHSAAAELLGWVIMGHLVGPFVGMALAAGTSFRMQRPLQSMLALDEIRRR